MCGWSVLNAHQQLRVICSDFFELVIFLINCVPDGASPQTKGAGIGRIYYGINKSENEVLL
jgi:hypothetical protein